MQVPSSKSRLIHCAGVTTRLSMTPLLNTYCLERRSKKVKLSK